jgi:hypothetical protein
MLHPLSARQQPDHAPPSPHSNPSRRPPRLFVLLLGDSGDAGDGAEEPTGSDDGLSTSYWIDPDDTPQV